MIIKIWNKEYVVPDGSEFTLTQWLLDILSNSSPKFDQLKRFEFSYFEGHITLTCSSKTKELIIKDYVDWLKLDDDDNKFRWYHNFYEISAIKLGGCRFNIIDSLQDDGIIKLEY